MLFVQDLPIKIIEDELLLYIKVTPSSSKDRIGKIFDGYLKIYVIAVAEDGQANKAVIKLLATELKISISNIFIKSGFTSNKKQVRLIGDRNSLIKRLQIVI